MFVTKKLNPSSKPSGNQNLRCNACVCVWERENSQQSSEVPQELLGLVEIDINNLWDKVWGALILKLLKLQELLIQYSLKNKNRNYINQCKQTYNFNNQRNSYLYRYKNLQAWIFSFFCHFLPRNLSIKTTLVARYDKR